MRRSVGIILAAATTLVGLAPSVGAATCPPWDVETFAVNATPEADVYRIGETAVIRVRVVRDATDQPVEDARVFVGLDWGSDRGALFDTDRTGPAGKAKIRIPLKHKHLDAGPVKMFTYAFKTQISNAVCGDVNEYGFQMKRRAFRITD